MTDLRLRSSHLSSRGTLISGTVRHQFQLTNDCAKARHATLPPTRTLGHRCPGATGHTVEESLNCLSESVPAHLTFPPIGAQTFQLLVPLSPDDSLNCLHRLLSFLLLPNA